MNKHIRLVVSVLFIVIILLAIGLTRFYFDVSKNTGSSSDSIEIIRKLSIDENGNRVFEGGSSLYGVVDENDKVIVAPEWIELDFAGNNFCTASKRIGGRLLTGCINYEGNITVPFIYRNINKYESNGFVFYTAETDSDGSCVIYDAKFNPIFMRSWDSCSIDSNELCLVCGTSTFTYNYGENGLICTRADVSGQAFDTDFQLNVYSRVLLTRLDCSMLGKICNDVSAYLEFAFTNDTESLNSISPVGNFSGFTPLFPEDQKITSKELLGISDIFIYAEKTENNRQTYAVSIITDIEISYLDEEDDEIKTFQGEYKAVVRFSASSAGITAVSGGFVKPEPDYPLPSDEEDTDDSQSGTEPSEAVNS